MMPVVIASLSEGLMIDIVAFGAEHPGLFAVLGHAVAAEIGKMRGKRRTLYAVTHDPGFDHRDARPVGHSAHRDEAGGPASAKGSLWS